jgi:hypothetical protein
MLPGQAVEVDRRMLDVQNDGPLTIQEEDVVRVASRKSLGVKRCRQAVRLGNGR